MTSLLNPLYTQVLATVAVSVSFIVCLLLVLTLHLHSRYSADPVAGVQKLHTDPTPRIGGLAIYMAVVAAYGAAELLALRVAGLLGVLIVAGLPVWALGMMEDVTKQVSARWRLLGAMYSALLACMITGLSIQNLHIPVLDWLLQPKVVSIAFTVVAVAGVVNAVNLIDGLNGLASGFACVAFAALGAIALSMGDYPMARLCVVLGSASLGFMLLNWPLGRIFLGDGGSYFLGFAIAWTSVQLTERHEAVTPFAAFVICLHPVLEAVFSMYRRWRRGQSLTSADRLHLHSLVLRRVVGNSGSWLNRTLRRLWGWDLSQRGGWVTNATCGLLLASLSIPAGVVAYAWRHDTAALVLASVFFALGYVAMYTRLVRFRWL